MLDAVTVGQGWPTVRYTLTRKSYIARTPGGEPEIIDPDNDQHDPIITYDGKPGPHMDPMCALGKEAKARAGVQHLDPTRGLSLVLGEETDLAKQLQTKQLELMQLMLQMQGLAPPQPGMMLHMPASFAQVPPAPAAAPAAPAPAFHVPPPPPKG